MIFVECKPDLLLVSKVTGKSRKEILHSGNKGEVVRHMSRSAGCIGLVDEDPGKAQPKYIESMILIKDDKTSNVKIYKDSKNNLLVVLCPVLEEWVMKTAKIEKIKMTDFTLPENPEKFHKIINLNLPKYEKLLDRLTSTQRMITLKTILSR